MEVRPKTQSKRGIWIYVGVLLTLAVAGVLLTREPADNYHVIKTYHGERVDQPFAESSDFHDGILHDAFLELRGRSYGLKGDLNSIRSDFRREFLAKGWTVRESILDETVKAHSPDRKRECSIVSGEGYLQIPVGRTCIFVVVEEPGWIQRKWTTIQRWLSAPGGQKR